MLATVETVTKFTSDWRSAVVIACVLLIVAGGFCLFDRDADGADEHGIDLCEVPVIAVAVVVLTLRLVWTREAIAEHKSSAYVALASLPDPPPKLAPTV